MEIDFEIKIKDYITFFIKRVFLCFLTVKMVTISCPFLNPKT